jgi:peptidyl-prolyl isomerase E (cyclophilin E)
MFVIRRNVVYVGGLAEQVGEELLHAAFIPFGDLKSIQIPRDYQMSKWISFSIVCFFFVIICLVCKDKHRGYSFVEFDLEEDAADAVDNMDGAELMGKTIRCNLAKAMPKLEAGQAAWNSEEWIQQNAMNLEGETHQPGTDRTSNLVLVPTRFEEEDD